MKSEKTKRPSIPKPPDQGHCGSMAETCQHPRMSTKAPVDGKNKQGKQTFKDASITKPGDGTRGGGKTVNKPGF
jgi:hypothetical protein